MLLAHVKLDLFSIRYFPELLKGRIYGLCDRCNVIVNKKIRDVKIEEKVNKHRSKHSRFFQQTNPPKNIAKSFLKKR